MTGDQALQELLDVSDDVSAAVIFDAEGEPLASTVGEESSRAAAEIGSAMLAYDDSARTGGTVSRLEAVTADGSVFVVREGERAVVAVTERDPVSGLVVHDLRAALKKTGRRTKERASAAS